MKRLQFRHHIEVFSGRTEVVNYFNNIVDSSHTASTEFGTSLYAEPMVAKYYDEDGNTQVIFAIGVDSGLTKYHTIDSKEIYEFIAKNADAIKAEELRAIAAEAMLQANIDAEVERAKESEAELQANIDAEIERAKTAEATLQANIDAETERAETVENDLQKQINDNVAEISQVTENLGENVREEFVLKNAKGEELGKHIRIYKDSALVGADVNYKGATGVTQDADNKFVFSYSEDMDKDTEYLYLIYRNEVGGLSLVGLDFENFLMENEEGFGIKIVDHKITIKIKGGEKYLVVNEEGLQTSGIDEAIEDAVYNLSEELNAKIDSEVARSIAADEYISGLTAEFSAATVNEFVIVNSAITVETERAIAAEENLRILISDERARAIEAEGVLSGAIDTEKSERIAADKEINAEIVSNQIHSKDVLVSKHTTGTTITIQTDETTITKFASASTIYDTNVAVLGSLLQVKKVEPKDVSVKSRYELQDANGKLIGDPIEMMVESALIDVKQGKEGDEIDPVTGNYITDGTGDTTMNFVYRLEDGTYELMQVVVADYFTDAHFGRGLNNQDGIVSLLEGDGNEYLVIGEDTIAVVGVNNAIAVAKKEAMDSANAQVEVLDKMIQDASNESAAYTDLKYADSTAHTETRYTESTAYTDTRINDVTSSVSELTETINTAVEGMNTTLNNAVEGMNTTLNGAVEGMNATLTEAINGVNVSLNAETANREAADADILRQLGEEVESRSQEDASIKEKLVTLENTDAALDTKVNSLSGNVISEILSTKNEVISTVTEAYKSADGVVFDSGKTYTDNAVQSVISAINGEKVKDVVYDSGNKKIHLIFTNGTVSEGFDASEFIVDGMLESVSFDNNTNEIKFAWNTAAGKTEVVVPLDKFVDQYTVSSESTSYLKISDDNKISAIVDNADGFTNTLATTTFVKTSSDEAYNKSVADLTILSGNFVTTLNSEIESLSNKHDVDINNFSGSILTYVDAKDATLLNGIDANTAKIDVLNGGKSVEGSVLYRIDNEFEKSLITDGLPATAVSPEEANDIHSLLRQVSVNGEIRYYVVSDSTSMTYITSAGTAVNLNDYITGLENRISNLETKLSEFETSMEDSIKSIIKSYIVGTANEISIVDDGDNLRVAFDDNAIFGEV